MAKIKKVILYVNGMHCPSCDVLIKDKFEESNNIVNVKPDFKKQKVEVFYTGSLNRELLNEKIKNFGYEIVDGELIEVEPFGKRLLEALAIAVIMLILYLIASELNIIPSFNFFGNLSLLTIFLIGLVASTSTCMTTSGALYLSLINKSKTNSNSQNNNNNLSKAIFFNLGRIFSYGFFGFLAGLIGKALITNLNFGSFLTLLAGIFMMLLGLDMVKILSIGAIIPSGLNKAIFENLEHKLMKYPRRAPFFLGALTYILPCGFTQAVQVYALGVGSPIQSAVTMIVFAIGTTPALLLVGGLTTFTKTSFYNYFIKIMGVLVFVVGITYFSNFLALYGLNINFFKNELNNQIGSVAKIDNGVQVIEMKVVDTGYQPNQFTVKKGIPVKWKIEGVNVFGCQAYLTVPKYNIQKTIQPGWQTVEFTPNETGLINSSCGMGMYRGRIEVIN